MADEAAAVEGGQSFLWWLLSPLLGLGIFLIPMAVIGFFMYKLVNSLNEKERKREEKKRLKEQKKKK